MDDAELRGCRQATLLSAIVALAVMIAAPILTGFRVDLLSFRAPMILAAVLALFLPYSRWRGMARLCTALECGALTLIMGLPVVVLSFAAMRLAFPLADATLIAADRAIGFDWVATVIAVDRLPMLARLLTYAYSSFGFQLLFLPMLLALLGHRARAYRFVLGYVLLCAIATAIGTFFPALGAYEGHGFDPRRLQHVDSWFGFFFLETFQALRSAPDFVLSADNTAGIVTFPSIHAGIAALCAWAAWDSRLLRAPLLVLNLLMAFSALTNGAHYLVDVLAGLAVAVVTIAAVQRLTTVRAGGQAAPAMAVPRPA